MTVDVFAPPTFLAAGLLALAGVAKTARPDATAQLLSDLGVPGDRGSARLLGVAEAVVAAWALVAPDAGGAFALAVSYLGFAGFLAFVLVARPGAGSCGCAGATAVPPSVLHLLLDVLGAGAAIGYAILAGPPVRTWTVALGAGAIPALGGLALAGWIVTIAVTEAPLLWRAWTPPPVLEHARHEHPRADQALAMAGIGPGHPSLWPTTSGPAEDTAG